MNWLEDNSTTIAFFSGIVLMASVHGLILACILLFNKSLNTFSNRMLSLAVLGVSIILLHELMYWLDLEQSIPLWMHYLPVYIRTTIPLGIFYFVLFLINPNHKLSRFERLGFWALGFDLLLGISYLPVNLIISDTETLEGAERFIDNLGWLLSIVVLFAYIPVALRRVNEYQKVLYENYSTTNKRSLKWLQTFLIIILVISIPWVASFVLYVFDSFYESVFVFGIVTVALVILLFWIGYFLLLQYQWFEIAPIKNQTLEEETSSTKLSANTLNYYHQLQQLLEEEKVYEDVHLTLDKLSEQLQISSGYLSQIIKEHEQKNFFELINSYRVESVKEKLLNDAYKNYTIMGIAMESGFNSKSTFNAVFKKFTNETPSAYKKRNS